MAWCPKCKNEYINGMTKCPDCGVNLVEAFEEENLEYIQSDDTDSHKDMDEKESFISSSTTYTKLSDKYEDVISSSYTLLIVGFIGGIAILLEGLGVFNIPISPQTKWLFYTVMGGIFIVFIIAGIISAMHAKQLKIDAQKEDETIDEILTWFRNNNTKESIDASIDTDIQEELLYFNRAEFMKNIMMHQYEDVDEPLIDSLIETLYQEFFES